jgi:hypothetical protein
MRTEEEIKTRLEQMIAQRPNFHDAIQIKRLDAEIKRLEWVLGTGPDVILVPKPAVML